MNPFLIKPPLEIIREDVTQDFEIEFLGSFRFQFSVSRFQTEKLLGTLSIFFEVQRPDINKHYFSKTTLHGNSR